MVDASKVEAVIGLARDLNLHTMVHCLLPTRELFDGLSTCSSGCTVSQALAGGKSATASLVLCLSQLSEIARCALKKASYLGLVRSRAPQVRVVCISLY